MREKFGARVVSPRFSCPANLLMLEINNHSKNYCVIFIHMRKSWHIKHSCGAGGRLHRL